MAAADPIKMLPCPFCEGPPVVIVQAGYRGGALALQDEWEEGADSYAFVFCHECGTEGPHTDDFIYIRDEYHAAEVAAIRLWNQRDARHRDMYDYGDAKGLNLHPRPEAPDV